MADRSSASSVPKSVMWPPAHGAAANLKVSAPPPPVTWSPPRPRLNTSLPAVPASQSPLLSAQKVWPPPDGVALEPPEEVEVEPPPPLEGAEPAGGSTRWPFCQVRLDGLTPSSVVTSQVPDTP